MQTDFSPVSAGFAYDAESFDGMTLLNVLRNWSVVWLGNIVGGGILIGALYGWLDNTDTSYTDKSPKRCRSVLGAVNWQHFCDLDH